VQSKHEENVSGWCERGDSCLYPEVRFSLAGLSSEGYLSIKLSIALGTSDAT
jgi:hypothetical protein